MVTKIGLPENRKRLKGLGIEHARSESFDKGYTAGFDAGVLYGRNQAALEKEQNDRVVKAQPQEQEQQRN
jgi:hypothetical protein